MFFVTGARYSGEQPSHDHTFVALPLCMIVDIDQLAPVEIIVP